MDTNVVKLLAISSFLLALLTPFSMFNLSAAPKLSNGPAFNQTSMIGKVFFDSNKNGYLDNNEAGIPGVRVATINGLVMETDAYGRFHIPKEKKHYSRFRQNQLLKVDTYSLPQGSRMTNENPRLLRTSNMALNKINFGVVY